MFQFQAFLRVYSMTGRQILVTTMPDRAVAMAGDGSSLAFCCHTGLHPDNQKLSFTLMDMEDLYRGEAKQYAAVKAYNIKA